MKRKTWIPLVALLSCSPRTQDAVAPAPPVTQPGGPGAAEAPTTTGTSDRAGGMWLPKQLTEHAATLKSLGLAIDPGQLADPMSHPLGAVVSLDGCSASFVSPDGLIITNHHCVTDILQFNSKPGNNLLDKGFLAKTRAEEKPAGPSERVFVTQSFKDVTKEMRDGIEKVAEGKARFDLLERREKELVATCEKKPNVRCDVVDMFGGGQYLLIERLEIRDVRLVYAPGKGVGNYGGEIDNWRWPRHTGDFSFLRAYVGKDKQPADPGPANVPYQPAHHLKLPSAPLSKGDLVFVAGYPGRTYRLYTAHETDEAVSWYYPRRVQLFNEYIAELDQLSKNDQDVAIKATPLSRGLNNALTYTKGTLEGLTQGGTLQQRKQRDTRLAQFIADDPGRRAKYGDVMTQLEKVFAAREKTRDFDFALWEVLRLSSLLDSAVTIVRMAEERPKPDAEREPEYQTRNHKRLEQGQLALDKRYSRKLEAGILALALRRAAKLGDAKARKRLLTVFLGEAEPTEQNIDKAVNKMLATTQLERGATRVQLLKNGASAQLAASKDPMIKAAVALLPLVKEREAREDGLSGDLALLRPKYVAALREMSPGPVAPDANSTLRVTFGTVKGYKPKPGAPEYEPFTWLSGVVKKATGEEPFDAPKTLLDAAKAHAQSPYADPKKQEQPVNFLADLDITGGNSGSPTLNAKGELVGLAFDGNYEAMASDWLFMPNITRSIHVDIRYVQWVMDYVDGADHLLKEMGATPAP